jgi:hypothetical protein
MEVNRDNPSPSKSSLLGLDGLNFLMADVRDGVGPFLSVYLKGALHWPAGQIGIAMAASSMAAALCQIPVGLIVDSMRAKRGVLIRPGEIRGGNPLPINPVRKDCLILFQYFPVPELTKTLLASLVGVLTLLGIMTRPFRWNEAVIAMAGAGVLLVLGLISPADALFTLVRDWNTFLFFLGMMGPWITAAAKHCCRLHC